LWIKMFIKTMRSLSRSLTACPVSGVWSLVTFYALCSAAPAASSPTMFSSHTAPAPAYSHQPANSIFLSHHSSHQLQPSEQSDGQNDNFVLFCSFEIRLTVYFLNWKWD
jgi:hypothetical protein